MTWPVRLPPATAAPAARPPRPRASIWSRSAMAPALARLPSVETAGDVVEESSEDEIDNHHHGCGQARRFEPDPRDVPLVSQDGSGGGEIDRLGDRSAQDATLRFEADQYKERALRHLGPIVRDHEIEETVLATAPARHRQQ